MLVAVTGMGQEELAGRLGVSIRAMQRYVADSSPQSQWMGYGDLCNLERIAVYRQRQVAAAEGRRRRKEAVSHA